MTGASGGGEYRDDNVIRPKAFEGEGFRGAGAPLNGGRGGDGGMLEARVAKLEADVAHIQRDVAAVQAELKLMNTTLGGLRADSATLIERTGHLATREWVGLRLFAAGTIIVLVLGGAVGFAPRLQAFLGQTPQPGPAASVAGPQSPR